MRRRATRHDPERGRICPVCAGPKREQSFRCWSCYLELLREQHGYWEKRTCPDCGGSKGKNSRRCFACFNRLRVPSQNTGRRQPLDHPWRAAERARVAA